jgi:hypothetical protein
VFGSAIDEIEDPSLVAVTAIRGYAVLHYFVIVLLWGAYEVPRFAWFWGVSQYSRVSTIKLLTLHFLNMTSDCNIP